LDPELNTLLCEEHLVRDKFQQPPKQAAEQLVANKVKIVCVLNEA
jgi:hypothetical protein